ncbi:ABC transporter substrate-binding protein [Mycolicibacterium nivoides]|uniref:ABC transporter substrate-binding protein n=1 Tax=Mycolicibacterium nivoides TaxID=2487344 RepID=UPI003C2EF76B
MTFDWQQSTSSGTQLAGIQVLETLYSLNEAYTPVPQLASAMPSVSADGLAYQVPLRQNVKFHNGAMMTAEDVVASLQRWAQVSSNGKAMFDRVGGIRAISASEVHITLSSPYDVVRALAVPISPAAIMPVQVISVLGNDPIGDVTQIVGSGPYKFVEWRKGQRYALERFADYRPADNGATGGLAAARPATWQRVEVNFVTDATTRFHSTLAGQYDVGLKIPGDFYSTLQRAENVTAKVVSPFYSNFMLTNTGKPPFGNQQVRQAAALALDRKPLADAAHGWPNLYTLNGAIYPAGMGVLSTQIGVAGYSQDISEARSLLKNSGYDGRPVTLLTQKEVAEAYNSSIAAAQQLEAAGFNVNVDVVEAAVMTARRKKPETWDLVIAGLGVGYVLPSSHLLLSGSWPFAGWYGHDGLIKAQLDRWDVASSDAERSLVMDGIQRQFYSDMPAIKLNDYAAIDVVSKSIDLGNQTFYWPTWWSAKAP